MMMQSMIIRLRKGILIRSNIDFFSWMCYNSGMEKAWAFYDKSEFEGVTNEKKEKESV